MNGTYISSLNWMPNLCISFRISKLAQGFVYELEG